MTIGLDFQLTILNFQLLTTICMNLQLTMLNCSIVANNFCWQLLDFK